MHNFLIQENKFLKGLWGEQPLPEWILKNDMVKLCASSHYAANILHRYPEAITLIHENNHWNDFNFKEHLATLNNCPDVSALDKQLRIHKHLIQTALIYAVIHGHLTQIDFLSAISNLAKALVNTCLNWHHAQLVKRLGKPIDHQGNEIRLCILAMGKFGGLELNFSSDIDLIFAYCESGQTEQIETSKTCDHEIFFRKLAQKLIASLDQVTADGFVYRIDMRLRPFGQSGPLTLSFEALENYYQLYGRDWERYALMKARPIAGDIEGGRQLLQDLRPFIYRRYLDYSALNAINEMKQGINEKIKEAGSKSHIKLGHGGIREAEFAVQAMQLVYGGQYPHLQNQNFLTVLQRIGELDFWDVDEVEAIQSAYLLLRTVENALQFEDEQQTHHLPEETSAWQRLALACGFTNEQVLQSRLSEAREIIHDKFSSVFDTATENTDDHNPFNNIKWTDIDEANLHQKLKQQGWSSDDSQILATSLYAFSQQFPWQRLTTASFKRVKKVLPLILEIAKNQYGPQAVMGVLNLIQAISGRHVYLDLLCEQAGLLKQLLNISQDSSWLMNFICKHPLVIGEVLSERELIADIGTLENDLNARIANLDEEEWLHALRDFKHTQIFKIAWEDITGDLPLMKVSDRLSWMAELVLKYTYERAYANLVKRYGEPRKNDGTVAEFAIIGYGKLGGLELSYSSDLDIIFLYDDHRSQGNTDGDKSIANQLFFTRLAQRISNYLTAASTSGILYEIDTRLRPNGQSGLLATSIESFIEYQQSKAWIWEHQALTRARPIIGASALCQKFQKIRIDILSQPASPQLRQEVIEMRNRMRNNQKPINNDLFDIKHSIGGLIDIEFIVQYLLLKHASQYPFILQMSDNIRQLAALEATGIISSYTAMTLRDQYRHLRRVAHHCYLNQKKSLVKINGWKQTQQAIITIWSEIFNPPNQAVNE